MIPFEKEPKTKNDLEFKPFLCSKSNEKEILEDPLHQLNYSTIYLST